MNKLTVIFAALMCVAGPVAASFTIVGDDPTYGNAQTPEFTKSLDGTLVLGPEDQDFMQAIVYRKLRDSFYVRSTLSVTGLVGLNQIRQKDVSLPVTSKNATGKAPHVFIALGYQWRDYGLELEHVNVGKLSSYKPNPIVPSLFGDKLRSEIDASVLVFNARAFFKERQTVIPWLKAQPYILGGPGYGRVAVTARTYDNVTGDRLEAYKKTKTGVAFGLGFGLRGRITEHFLLDTAIRTHYLPKPRIGPISGVTLTPNVYWSAVWTLGLEFVF